VGKRRCYVSAFLALWISGVSVVAGQTGNPYLGRWALTIPGGGAGWLGVEQKEGYLAGNILWGGGSVVPVASAVLDDETLLITRMHKVERKNDAGDVVLTQYFTELITAKASGNMLSLTRHMPRFDGTGVTRSEFTGKRIAPLPPKPDLSQARYGNPIVLFDGTDMADWKLTNPRQANGWSVENGILVNKPAPHRKGGRRVSYGNLRTIGEFEDFNLKLEVNVPRRGNSGVYLRGIYEVQVADTRGRPLDSHNMGGIYSRITPTAAAEKPAGQWQTMDITLLDRHVTVVLNGQKIIDNQPLLGCTGGALTADEFRPGPIYLQGDHTGVSYRNIVLRPSIK